MKSDRNASQRPLSWRLVLVITLASLVGVTIASAMVRPTYTASTKLFVGSTSQYDDGALSQVTNMIESRLDSYVALAGSARILQPVIDSLQLQYSPEELSRKISVFVEPQTVLITIAVTDESPNRAAAISHSVSESFQRAVGQLESPGTGQTSALNLVVISPAVAPTAPATPNWFTNWLLGGLCGLALGVASAMAQNFAEKRVRSDQEVAGCSAKPVLASIHRCRDETKGIPATGAPDAKNPEAFAQLRSNLRFADISPDRPSLLVTSAIHGEGRTSIALNLALSEARAGRRVVVVDCQLRQQSSVEYLLGTGRPGVTELLVGKADLSECVRKMGQDALFVLSSGSTPPNPADLLGSNRMAQLVQELEDLFDLVILDGPPLLPYSDATLLSRSVGGVIFVIDTQRLRVSQLSNALKLLDAVEPGVSGFVLNKVPISGDIAGGPHDRLRRWTLPNSLSAALGVGERTFARVSGKTRQSAPAGFGVDHAGADFQGTPSSVRESRGRRR